MYGCTMDTFSPHMTLVPSLTAFLDSRCYSWLADNITPVLWHVSQYSTHRSILDPPGYQAIPRCTNDCAQPSEISGHGVVDHCLFRGLSLWADLGRCRKKPN